MSLRTVALLALVMIPMGLSAQQDMQPVTSSSLPRGRYEVVQSPLAARSTFLLDKFTGQVHQWVSLGEEEGSAWQPLPPLRDDSRREPGEGNYQLFFSGLAARFTFLTNVHSGAVWQLVVDDENALHWQRTRVLQP